MMVASQFRLLRSQAAGAAQQDAARIEGICVSPAARAVADALPLLTRAKRVHIVTVSNEKRIDTRRSGPELARHLARHGVDVILETVDAAGRSIGGALEAATRVHDSDLLVMGAYGHSRLREFVLGGATRSMITRPPLPVLLSH
jgi:nucleotide-binding universal stress UspA family protein